MWYKQAQQGRLNLDTQTGVENFREELKALIGKSLVRNKLNPLQFVINFDKLNTLLRDSILYEDDFVYSIQDIKKAVKLDPLAKDSRGRFIPESKQIFIPAVYDAKNYTTYLHEVVHSIDPVVKEEPGKSFKLKQENAKDSQRLYYNRRDERLAFMENLHNFYSEEKLEKVLEIFYIKEKKKYPTRELATRAFMNDLKNYMQNPEQSILLQPSRFHSYMVAVNENSQKIDLLLMGSYNYKPLSAQESKEIFGDVKPDSLEGNEKYKEYLRKHPDRTEPRDIQYYRQLKKFFTNVYLKTESKIMPNNSAPVRPFDASKTISLAASKNWLAKLWVKTDGIPLQTAQNWVDYLTYKRRDLYNNFLSTLMKLNIVLDESFNLQDPRWQILEPIVELMLNELIKYLENPQQYKTDLQTDEQKIIKQLNKEIDKIINDKKIKDKKAYFLEHWSDSLKKLGTLEQNELLGKFPSMSFDQGINIMRNIGQK
jgi:hypothetical protein